MELKAFLGLTGFYRAFIPDFTRSSQALNALTSDHVQFDWSYDCEEAFINLKEKLSSKPVPVFHDLNKPFIVEVDASNFAVGGVLT